MRRITFGLSIATLVALAGIFMVTPARAEEPGSDNPLKVTPELTASWSIAKDLFSGRVWLAMNGLDPVLHLDKDGALKLAGDNPGNSPRMQAVGPGGAAFVPYRNPSAKFSRNILVTEDTGSVPIQTEPHLAVDPKDPDHLLLGVIDYNSPSMVTYVSIDGGATWEGPTMTKYPRRELGTAGDPVVAFNRKGEAYYGFISLDVQEFVIGPAVGEALVSGISVGRSTDGGFTWEDAISSAKSGVTSRPLPSTDGRPRGEVNMEFLDKPWMVIGPNPKDPTKDIIYVSYTKFTSQYQLLWIDEVPVLGYPALATVIEVVKSEDGGLTWSPPAQVSPRAFYVVSGGPESALTLAEPQAIAANRQVVQGSSLAIAPDGTAYVAWLDSTPDDVFKGSGELWVSSSKDGGNTWGSAVLATTFLEPPFRPRNANFRYWATAFPRLATGPQGQVYVVHGGIPPDNPQDEGDIYVLSSTDGGRTWSRRQRVTDDSTGRLQFFPDVSVGPDGTLHAMWADMRDDALEVAYNIYYASSTDGGKTWASNSRVTDFPTNPNRAFPRGVFIGDYFAIKATDKDVYMVWADGRLGEFGGANQKIGFARQRLMPTPSIFISPPKGPGGKDIVIQGFDFQPDREVFISVAGAIVSTDRVSSEGRFSSRLFVPIAGQGAHEVRAIDASGNVATSTFFMDFGFDDIQKSNSKVDELAQQIRSLAQSLGQQSGGSGLQEMKTQLQQIQSSLDTVKQQQQEETGQPSAVLPYMVALGVVAFVAVVGWALVLTRRTRKA